MKDPRPAVYYFLGQRNGRPAIKIGVSQSPLKRMRQVGATRLLAWHPGGYRSESQLHRRFVATRITGTEWFRPSIALLAHIGTLADASDPPGWHPAPPPWRCGPCHGDEPWLPHVCF